LSYEKRYGEAVVADGVKVETDGLNKFSDQVQDDTSRTLESGYSNAKVDLSSGVQFGAKSASGGVHAAKQRYAQSLKASTDNVAAYLDAARILADAAAKVATAFAATDGRAAGRTDEVQRALNQAVQESQQRRAQADGHPTTRGTGVRAI
jgi:hypothetical protein